MITTVKLINTSITSHSYHFVCECVCVCVIRTHKIYSPSNSQVCNTVLLTIVTMLCIISPELIYLNNKVCTFDQCFSVSPICQLLEPPFYPLFLSTALSYSTCKCYKMVFVFLCLAYSA